MFSDGVPKRRFNSTTIEPDALGTAGVTGGSRSGKDPPCAKSRIFREPLQLRNCMPPWGFVSMKL